MCHIEHGIITNPKAVRTFFDNLDEGWWIIRGSPGKKRTLKENRFYWGVVVPLIQKGLYDAGYQDVRTNEDAHEVIKSLFLKRTISSPKTGDDITISGSTANLSTVEFEAFLDEIRLWASVYLGIIVPYPNEENQF